MQKHYRLADGVHEDEASLVFNNAFKHTRCTSMASYYTQVNLLPFCTQLLNLLIFYFDMQM
jgi:hypothetical protein